MIKTENYTFYSSILETFRGVNYLIVFILSYISIIYPKNVFEIVD